jgi:hypothetical protein
MKPQDRLLRALFGEPRFWASYEEMAEAAEKLRIRIAELEDGVASDDLEIIRVNLNEMQLIRMQEAVGKAEKQLCDYIIEDEILDEDGEDICENCKYHARKWLKEYGSGK